MVSLFHITVENMNLCLPVCEAFLSPVPSPLEAARMEESGYSAIPDDPPRRHDQWQA